VPVSSPSSTAASSISSSSFNSRSTTLPTSTLTATSTATQAISSSHKLSTRSIVGIVIGSVGGLSLAGFLLWYLRKKRNVASVPLKRSIKKVGGYRLGDNTTMPTPLVTLPTATRTNPQAVSLATASSLSIRTHSRNSNKYTGPPANAAYSPDSPGHNRVRLSSAEEHARFAGYDRPAPSIPGSLIETEDTHSNRFTVGGSAPIDGRTSLHNPLNDSSMRRNAPTRPPRPTSLVLDPEQVAYTNYLGNQFDRSFDTTTFASDEHDERYDSFGATPYPGSSRYSMASSGRLSGTTSSVNPLGSRQWDTPSMNERIMESPVYHSHGLTPTPLNVARNPEISQNIDKSNSNTPMNGPDTFNTSFDTFGTTQTHLTKEPDTFNEDIAPRHTTTLHSSRIPAHRRAASSVYSRQIDGITLNTPETLQTDEYTLMAVESGSASKH
jgi:hypothetical protein